MRLGETRIVIAVGPIPRQSVAVDAPHLKLTDPSVDVFFDDFPKLLAAAGAFDGSKISRITGCVRRPAPCAVFGSVRLWSLHRFHGVGCCRGRLRLLRYAAALRQCECATLTAKPLAADAPSDWRIRRVARADATCAFPSKAIQAQDQVEASRHNEPRQASARCLLSVSCFQCSCFWFFSGCCLAACAWCVRR